MAQRITDAKPQLIRVTRKGWDAAMQAGGVEGKGKPTAAMVVALVLAMLMSLSAMSRQEAPPAKEKPPSDKHTPSKRPVGKAENSGRITKKSTRAAVSTDIMNPSNWARIPAGEFSMGSKNGEPDERPVHHVRISHAFEIGKYEVTQAQWEGVMGNNPSDTKGASLPVETVSWNDVQQFIKNLNARDYWYIYRLPTEAEWEYACRAGSKGDYAGNIEAMSWHTGNAGHPHPVGRKQPNAWGLFDMHGNVYEWCQDFYYSDYYTQSSGVDPKGPTTGSEPDSSRVYRGGGWATDAPHCRSAARGKGEPNTRHLNLGFRLVRTQR
jgi:formylglycine-generating enzyme required for sulfatase activity